MWLFFLNVKLTIRRYSQISFFMLGLLTLYETMFTWFYQLLHLFLFMLAIKITNLICIYSIFETLFSHCYLKALLHPLCVTTVYFPLYLAFFLITGYKTSFIILCLEEICYQVISIWLDPISCSFTVKCFLLLINHMFVLRWVLLYLISGVSLFHISDNSFVCL